MSNKFHIWTLIMISIASLLAGVGWYWYLQSSSRSFQDNQKQNCQLDRQTLMIEPRDASCDIFEEETSPSFVFTVTNASRNTVKISNIIAGCSCTKVVTEKSELAPGESTRLEVVYNAISLYGLLPRRTITLHTSEEGSEPATCTVGGTRQRRYQIEPASVQFGRVTTGQSPSSRVSISVLGTNSSIISEKLLVDSKWFTTKVISRSPQSGGTTELVLDVTVLPNAPIGRLEGRIFVPRKEDDGNGPIIPVFAEISGPVILEPARTFFGILAPGDKVVREVSIKALQGKSADDKPVITSIGKSPSGVRVTHSETDDKSPKLVIEVDAAGMALGYFESEVVVEVKFANQMHRLRLLVTGLVTK